MNSSIKIIYDIYNKKFEEFKNPKISIIINVVDKEGLERLFNSIQKQSLLDIEINVIDDNKKNNNSIIYNKIKNNDKRVKILDIKNKIGNLNKKIEGINNSNGEYILFIDSDDYFIQNYTFKSIYDIAINEKIDIIEFTPYTLVQYHNSILYQPELFDEMYFTKDNYFDLKQTSLKGKLIKKDLLKNAIKSINNYYIQQNIDYNDEKMILLILFKKAKSFKILRNKVTEKIYLNNNLFEKKNKKDFLLFLKFMFQYTDNNVPEKRFVATYFIKSFKNRNIYFEKEELKLLNETINLYLNCDKISDNDLLIIKRNYHIYYL